MLINLKHIILPNSYSTFKIKKQCFNNDLFKIPDHTDYQENQFLHLSSKRKISFFNVRNWFENTIITQEKTFFCRVYLWIIYFWPIIGIWCIQHKVDEVYETLSRYLDLKLTGSCISFRIIYRLNHPVVNNFNLDHCLVRQQENYDL